MNETHTAYKVKWSVKFKRHGAHIKDADADRTVHVTAEDIKHAVCRDHQKCGFALAIKRVTGADWVDVSTSRVLVKTGKHTARRYLLPPMAVEQLKYFDTNDGRMAPCKLTLKAPKRYDVLGARKRCK